MLKPTSRHRPTARVTLALAECAANFRCGARGLVCSATGSDLDRQGKRAMCGFSEENLSLLCSKDVRPGAARIKANAGAYLPPALAKAFPRDYASCPGLVGPSRRILSARARSVGFDVRASAKRRIPSLFSRLTFTQNRLGPLT